MYNKLAFRHKNSIPLQPCKSRVDKNESKSFSNETKSHQFIVFPAITCAIFVTYWFIICPLIWSICYSIARARHWHDRWSFFFWITALLVWILIMVILVSIWKHLKRVYTNTKTIRSYGSDDCETPALMTNGKQDDLDLIHLRHERKRDKVLTEDDEVKIRRTHHASNNEKKRPVDLPPLSIHRHMSGNDIENNGDVTIENPPSKTEEDMSLSKITDDINRRSMKEYLTLVTLTPTKDDEAEKKSPKTPMSPRDLFFIDLIREAEKAESAGKKIAPIEYQHFFPNDPPPLPTSAEENALEPRAEEEEKLPLDAGTDRPKSEADYFIACVESPLAEKTEVFIEIEPSTDAAVKDDNMKQWTVDTNKEKPILTLETSSINEINDAVEESDNLRI